MTQIQKRINWIINQEVREIEFRFKRACEMIDEKPEDPDELILQQDRFNDLWDMVYKPMAQELENLKIVVNDSAHFLELDRQRKIAKISFSKLDYLYKTL